MKRKDREEGGAEMQKFRRVAPKIEEQPYEGSPSLPLSPLDIQRQQQQQLQQLQQFQQQQQPQYVLPQ